MPILVKRLDPARKYLQPDRMLYIVVGDRSKIESDIEKLGLGTVEHWTVDATRAAN